MRKDLDAMHRDYAASYRLFDVKDTANGVAEVKALWERCFPYFEKPVIEYKDMVIEATEGMAVAHFYCRMSGLVDAPEGDMPRSWLRGTVCFRKDRGVWTCIHEHISFPVNCETGEIAFILDDEAA